MEKFSFKAIFIPTLTLLVICVLSAGLLGGTNLLTANRIKTLAEQKTADAMKEVLSADSYSPVEIGEAADALLYAAKNEAGEVIGYVTDCTRTGYGGDVEVIVGVNMDGGVTKISVVSCDDETPGLGQNIKTDDFKSRFEGIKNEVALGDNVDAWTGATFSSKAVAECVNTALGLFDKYGKGGAE